MPSNRPSSQPTRRNVRYDRVLALIVILVLLIVLLVKCCSSCSSDKSSGDTTATTTTTETQPATESAESMYEGIVYLSPSNQSDNTFATGDTDEATVCRAIAEKTAAVLEQAGVSVLVAGESDSIQQKTAMGDYALGAYVAIHTNQGTGYGTSCYYNSSSAQSQSLAQAVYDPVALLTERDDNGLIDGSQSGSDAYQYEIASNNSPCCLIEVEYHDTTTVAQWLIDNEDEIAIAIAGGICSYLGVTSSGTSSSASDSTAATDLSDSNAIAIEDQLSE